MQEAFHRAANISTPDYWLYDGIHPTPAGHRLIAKEWIKATQEIFRVDGNTIA